MLPLFSYRARPIHPTSKNPTPTRTTVSDYARSPDDCCASSGGTSAPRPRGRSPGSFRPDTTQNKSAIHVVRECLIPVQTGSTRRSKRIRAKAHIYVQTRHTGSNLVSTHILGRDVIHKQCIGITEEVRLLGSGDVVMQ